MIVLQRCTAIFFIFLLAVLTAGQAETQTLPSFSTTLFAGAGDCQFCHAAGSGVLTSSSGEDISPPAHWRSSMMANASKDPFWRAKVTAETLENPAIAAAIEDKCCTCHAPMGHRQSRENGQSSYGLADLLTDTAGLDGVSCTLCHQVQDNRDNTEESFSGHYNITSDRLIFGPYQNPASAQMKNVVDYTPTYSDHVNESELCATCHTLFTSYVDNDGNLGGAFPEQTPYLEWQNSKYPGTGESCQSCHMPSLDESLIISLRPPVLSTKRTPVWRHVFVGGNTFLPAIINMYPSETGAYSGSQSLDMTEMNAREMIGTKTAEITVSAEIQEGTLLAEVEVTNLCGHKFPTGYPSRQAWIHFRVSDPDGALIFESGNPDTFANPAGDSYSPHYDVISDPAQVQIYESVMGDVDGKPTATLLRGASYLKDNRLPPAGFAKNTGDYASMAIMGAAADDGDFNKESTSGGSGGDTVHYQIPFDAPGGNFTVSATLYYRSISEHFANSLFTHDNNTVVNTFKTMHDEAVKQAEEVDSASTVVIAPTSVENSDKPEEYTLGNYPNPFNAGTAIQVHTPEQEQVSINVYNITGQNIATIYDGALNAGTHVFSWQGVTDSGTKVESGIYFLNMRAGDTTLNRKITLLE